MIHKALVRPEHSILYLEDVAGGDNTPQPPAKDDPAQAWATRSCVLFHILPEPDGPTEVTMGLRHEIDPGTPPKFSGEIETPSRAVRVVEVDDTVVFEMPVAGATTKVSIWFSHPKWPDKVTIGLE
ncbi:MAG: hypothetical protein JNK84_06620 [Phreatobacter sp.]|uniref:hypothetical protein n=1 Tax=Phreatobacter sp. TaxID=1966341 RepID=UPI001A4BAFF5|nr:hypothetical protein [Phreatobacter sp.]MBL8568743.1 hypothetical protein [Phreatobacter sp.]